MRGVYISKYASIIYLKKNICKKYIPMKKYLLDSTNTYMSAAQKKEVCKVPIAVCRGLLSILHIHTHIPVQQLHLDPSFLRHRPISLSSSLTLGFVKNVFPILSKSVNCLLSLYFFLLFLSDSGRPLIM